MKGTSEQDARRVAPSVRTPDGSDRFDYADAFETTPAVHDERTAEEWMRCGLEEAPRLMRLTILVAHRFVLGFRLAPRSAPGTIMGWRIVSSAPDLVHLQAVSPLMHGDLVARRDSPTRMVLSTYLSYSRPGPARLLWTVVGPVHRRIAPYLLRRSATAGARPR